MSYRDDRAALDARVLDLEARLARAEAAVEEPPSETITGRALFDVGPRTLRLEAEIPHAVSTDGLEAVVRTMRERLGIDAVRVGATVVAPRDEICAAVSGRSTRLVLRRACGMDGWAVRAWLLVLVIAGLTVRAGWMASRLAVAGEVGGVASTFALALAPVLLVLAAIVWVVVRRRDEQLRQARLAFAAAIVLATRHRSSDVELGPPGGASRRPLGAGARGWRCS